MAAATYFDAVQKLYIAFYQRPADPAGLLYWAGQVDAKGGDQTAVVAAFATSAESTALYGSITVANIGTVIDAIYLALFNAAPDAAGKKFYVDGFTAGTFTAGSIALNVLNGALGSDATAIANKLTVSNSFTAAVDGRVLTSASFGVGPFAATYDSADVTTARTYLKAVTSSAASVKTDAQVKSDVEVNIANPGDPILPSVFTLTTGVDKGASFTGTAANETYTATLGSLNSGDEINGGGGVDTLNAEVTAAIDNTVKFTSVEALKFNVLAGAVAADTTNFTGVTSYTSNGVGALTLNNVSGTSATLIKSGNSSALTTAYVAGSVAGGSDTQKISLESSTGGLITVGAGVETLEVTVASGSTSAAALATTATSLFVKGGGTVTLGSGAAALPATLTTIDARDTAKSTLTVALAATSAAILTGGGDDSVNLLTGDIGAVAGNLVSMGAGTDTLTLTTGQTAANAASLVGVENARFGAAGNLLDLANSSGAIAFDVRAGGAVTLNNVQSGVSLKATTAGTLTDVTVGFRAAVTGETFTVTADRAQTTAVGGIAVVNAQNVVLNYNSNTASTAVVGGIVLDSTVGGTDVTKSLTITTNGAGGFTTGAITSTGAGGALETLTLNAAKGQITTGVFLVSNSLTTISATADQASVTIGKIGGTLATDSSKLDSVTLTAKASAIVTADVADITANNLAGISTVKLDATGGAIGATGAGNAFDLVNTGGVKDLTISGVNAIFANITTGAAAAAATVTKVTSTATGGLTLTIADGAGTYANGAAGSTVTLGNAIAGQSNTIVTAGARDVITGGSGVDVLTGGAFADKYTLGAGRDVVNQGSTAGTNGVFADTDGSATVNTGDTLTFAFGADVITDFAVGATGDTLNVGTATLGAQATALIGTLAIAGNAINVGVSGNVVQVRGNWNDTTNVFTVNTTTGADIAVVYDASGATAPGVATQQIILTGIGGTGLTAATDLILIA